MTLVQLEYIVAVDTYKSFILAAEKCFVTQPTLSMQIKKLEEHIGTILFDRSKQPVITTEAGALIIEQARIVLKESNKINEIVKYNKNIVEGLLRIGIIPTLAPYLLPLFLNRILAKYPLVKIIVEEQVTETLISKLKNDLIDCALLATPVTGASITATSLFYEPFVIYASKNSVISKNKTVSLNEITLEEMWIMNEGHCLRSQVQKLCFGNSKGIEDRNFEYQSGSIETLKKLVENNGGFTILPELSIADFGIKQMNRIRYFRSPEPSREISILTHRNEVKKSLIHLLTAEILNAVPQKMKNKNQKNIIDIG